MGDDSFTEHLFDYRHDGTTWGFSIKARSRADALARLKSLGWATYRGELLMRVPIAPSGVAGLPSRLRAALLRLRDLFR